MTGNENSLGTTLCRFKVCDCMIIPETCEGENLSEFRGFVAIRESFVHKSGGMVSFSTAQASNPRTPGKSYISPIHESFLPQKFPTIQYAVRNTNC